MTVSGALMFRVAIANTPFTPLLPHRARDKVLVHARRATQWVSALGLLPAWPLQPGFAAVSDSGSLPIVPSALARALLLRSACCSGLPVKGVWEILYINVQVTACWIYSSAGTVVNKRGGVRAVVAGATGGCMVSRGAREAGQGARVQVRTAVCTAAGAVPAVHLFSM